MDISLHRGQKDFSSTFLPTRFFCLDVGQQIGDGLFHHPSRLHDLRQKHFPLTKKIPNNVHSVHQMTFDDFNGAVDCQAGLLYVLRDKLIDSLHQRMGKPLLQGLVSPGFFRLFFGCTILMKRFGIFQKSLGGILPSIQ